MSSRELLHHSHVSAKACVVISFASLAHQVSHGLKHQGNQFLLSSLSLCSRPGSSRYVFLAAAGGGHRGAFSYVSAGHSSVWPETQLLVWPETQMLISATAGGVCCTYMADTEGAA